MGAWGIKAYENDGAADWFGDLWDEFAVPAKVEATLRLNVADYHEEIRQASEHSGEEDLRGCGRGGRPTIPNPLALPACPRPTAVLSDRHAMTVTLECCCGPSFWRTVNTAKGTMEGESISYPEEKVMLPSMIPLPMNFPIMPGQAAEIIVDGFTEIFADIIGALPSGVDPELLRYAEQEIQGLMEKMAEEGPPNNMKWKGGN